MVLKKETENGAVGTVVPNHEQIKIGTLRSILKLAKISEEEFSEFV